MAASMCVRELEFIAFVRLVRRQDRQVIGVFFGTRVAIELLYVFIKRGVSACTTRIGPSIRRA